ncbi:MAG: 4Fe-4S binding protein [Actinobacteria bacterium]|nr:4Fe-4S binding protein [Actinomycetota bacterium]
MGLIRRTIDFAVSLPLEMARRRPLIFRNRRTIEFIVSFWPLIQIWKRSVAIPALRALARPVFSEKGLQASFIPVGENVNIPPSVIPPMEVIADFLNRASYLAMAYECVCRVGGNCEKFPREVGSIFMGEGARELHPSMGRQVSVDEAAKHIEHALEIGLVPMIGHLMVDSMLFGMHKFDRFLTMCFCCECCCFLLSNMRGIKDAFPNSVMPIDGVNIEVTGTCNGCGICRPVCPVDDISISQGKAVIGDLCIGCGCCSNTCPENAIKVTVDPDSKVLEELRRRVEARTNIE